MKKRIFALLLMLAMLLSALPMTAGAECYHYNGYRYISAGNGYHHAVCADCGVYQG